MVQQGLAVKGGNVFVEVDSEEVKIAYASIERVAIVLKTLIKVSGCFGCNGPNLLVAASIAGNEDDRDSAKLENN